jgi:hypothetical protein
VWNGKGDSVIEDIEEQVRKHSILFSRGVVGELCCAIPMLSILPGTLFRELSA